MLELRQLACLRGSRLLFRHLSAELKTGELLRVTGANGAGKTSLLRMLCGLLPPTAGAVKWRGKPIQTVRESYAQELLYVGHAAALKNDLSAIENLLIAETLAGRQVSQQDGLSALQAAGLNGRENMPTRYLSQGQKKRVHLARLALASAPALWILDEPLNALDAAGCAWLADCISGHLHRGGSVILTSHQPLTLADGAMQRELVL